MQEIYQGLQPIFAEIFEDGAIEISASTGAKDIPLWDSLHHVLLIAAIEGKYDIEFDLEELTSMQNVGDIVKAIESKRNAL